MSMIGKLYRLAIWYIGKCNAEWDNRRYAKELEQLDRLTYKNFGKYMLYYGADAEWEKFSRYEVLDNAIQKLAKYENEEQEIRNKAIDEFVERLKNKYPITDNGLFTINDDLHRNIEEIAEKVKRKQPPLDPYNQKEVK